MIDISTLRAMVAAGASAEIILAAVEAELLAEGARVQASKAKAAERQQRWRDKRNVSQHLVTSRDVTAPSRAPLSSFLPSLSETQIKKEESKKERAADHRKSALPSDWKPSEAHYAKAAKRNLPRSFVDDQADAMRDWAASKGVMRHSWDATFNGFLRPKESRNGFGGPRPLQDDSKSISAAAGRLAEAAERGEYSFGPRPQLLPEPNETPVFLLSKG